MKNIWAQIKWIKGQTRTFIFFLSLPLIIEGIVSITNVSMAIISKNLIDAATNKQKDILINYAILFIILIILEMVLDAVLSIIKVRNTEAISNSMRQNLFNNLTQKEWIEFSKYHSGDILTRMTSDISNIVNIFVSTIPDIVSLGVSLVASFIALLYFEPSLAVIAFILGPISVVVSRLYGRKLKKINLEIQQSEGRCRSLLQESIQNMTIIKTFCLEKTTDKQIEELQGKKYNLVMGRGKLSVISNSALSFTYWLGYILAFGWGVVGLFSGSATFGTLTAFTQLISKIQGPFTGLAYSLPQLISASASIERLMEIEGLENEIISKRIFNSNNIGIQFENVNFFYEKDKNIIKNISTQICPGEITALVGPSGQGKTTFIRLILSLLRPKEGKIYMTRGQEKFEISASTRRLISYVPQGNTLFSGTIEENLRFGCADASEYQIKRALQLACAWDFVKELKNGIHTVIGERGVGLSEGQAQRLAIARALLRKTPIIIFDEATSALDSNTEMSVLKAISNLSPIRTCIIITHRTSTLEICHRILRMEDGSLVEVNNRSEVALERELL